MNEILGLCNALKMDLTLFSLKNLRVMSSSGRRVVIFAVSVHEDCLPFFPYYVFQIVIIFFLLFCHPFMLICNSRIPFCLSIIHAAHKNVKQWCRIVSVVLLGGVLSRAPFEMIETC